MVWYGIWCYALRFLIPLVSLLVAHSLALQQIRAMCVEEGSGGGAAACRAHLSALTRLNMTALTAHILLVSLSFVSRTDHLWNLKPRKSWPILVAGSAILGAQALFLLVSLAVSEVSVPALAWIIYVSATPLVCLFNELIKRQEIKVNVRFQKRARLEFGTKLGINSPF
jgi:hypothetical protein